jgi:hypothetical protein
VRARGFAEARNGPRAIRLASRAAPKSAVQFHLALDDRFDGGHVALATGGVSLLFDPTHLGGILVRTDLDHETLASGLGPGDQGGERRLTDHFEYEPARGEGYRPAAFRKAALILSCQPGPSS